jgi:S1-C subfamily serine protease
MSGPQGAEVPEAVLRAEALRVECLARSCQAAIAVLDRSGSGIGSAVVISRDGYALTNVHVVEPVGAAMRCGMPDGVVYDAVVVGLDPTGDVALIQLLGRDDFPYAEMGDSDKVRVGDWVYVVGNPLALAHDFQPSVSRGVVSGVRRYQPPYGTLYEYTDGIQTDAAINAGNSGGPLFDANGRLIGVVGRASFEKRGRVNVGVGYAISINQIKNFMGHLHGGLVADHATLGATVVRDDLGRVVVDDIVEGSDVFRRGLRVGDEIFAFAGRDIDSVNSMKNVLGTLPRGWRVPLSFRHNEQTRQCLVRLAGVHPEGRLASAAEGPWDIPSDDESTPKPTPGEAPTPDDRRAQPPTPAQEASLPDAVRDRYEKRPGFANYFYNRLHQERIWQAYSARHTLNSGVTHWILQGRFEGGSDVTIELSPDLGVCSLSDGVWKTRFDPLDEARAVPPGSGGLLVAMHVWQSLLVSGSSPPVGSHYQGRSPLAGRTVLCDVLSWTTEQVESVGYFDAESGALLALEVYLQADADPCEIYFGQFREDSHGILPGRMDVRFGDRLYAVIHIDRWTMRDAAP